MRIQVPWMESHLHHPFVERSVNNTQLRGLFFLILLKFGLNNRKLQTRNLELKWRSAASPSSRAFGSGYEHLFCSSNPTIGWRAHNLLMS